MPLTRFIGRVTRIACLDAAVLFANVALEPIKERTNVKAVKQWRKNNRDRIQWLRFEGVQQ
jgi:hypothetical protein